MGFSRGGILAGNAATTGLATHTRPPVARASVASSRSARPAVLDTRNAKTSTRRYVSIQATRRLDTRQALPGMDKRLKAQGYDATITLYHHAHHAFDAPFGFELRLPGVQENASACHPVYKSILKPDDIAKNYSASITKGATAEKTLRLLRKRGDYAIKWRIC